MRCSVIIPTYNPTLSVLDKTIQSLNNQTYDDLEIIVIIDDHISKCNLDNFFMRYEMDSSFKPHLSWFNAEAHTGKPGLLINRAILFSRGQYINIHDHDDISEPDKIEKLMSAVDGYNFAMSKVTVKSPRKKTRGLNKEQWIDLFNSNKVRSPTHLGSCVFKKSYIKHLGGFDKHMGYDAKFITNAMVCSMFNNEHIPFVDKSLYTWNVNPKSYSIVNAKKFDSIINNIYKHIIVNKNNILNAKNEKELFDILQIKDNFERSRLLKIS